MGCELTWHYLRSDTAANAEQVLAPRLHPDKLQAAMLLLQEASGTVLVFLGNESPLDTPQQPIIFENADRHNALVILVEHR